MTDEQPTASASAVHHVYLGDEDLGILDENKFSVSDAYLIKGQTGGHASGLSPKAFFAGLQEMEPQCLQAIVWFLRFKKGEQVHITQIDFAISDLRIEDEPDPTQARSGSDETATSEPSQNSD